MKVYVTPAQFDVICRAKYRFDALGDPADARWAISQMAAACIENGGDFVPSCAMRIPTELIVIYDTDAQ